MADKPYLDPDREELLEARKRVQRFLSSALLILGRDVAKQVVKWWAKSLQKADDPSLEDLLAAISFEFDDDLADDLIDEFGRIYSSTGQLAIAQVGANVSSDLVNQVNLAAIEWAEEHVGNLIGINPDSPYSITDATRNMIRGTIVQGMEENLSSEDIGERIEELYAFSEDRAQLIAMTEIATANSMGALEGYQAAKENGVEVGKSWLILEDACDQCHKNEEQGVIPLDQEFQSGDMTPPAHPNCRCVIVPEVGFKKWDGAKHPRHPAGTERGGEFATKEDQLEDLSNKTAGNFTVDWGDVEDYDPGRVEDLERAAWVYTGSGYEDINDYLRHGKVRAYPTRETLLKRVSQLDEYISKARATEEVKVYRGLSQARLEAVLERGHFSDAAYVSTSASPFVAAEYAASDVTGDDVYRNIMEVRIPKGSQALPMSMSRHSSEREILLPRGASFKVIGVSYKKMPSEDMRNEYGPVHYGIGRRVRVIHVDYVDPAGGGK